MDINSGKVTRHPEELEKLHILIVLQKGVHLDLHSDYFDSWIKKYGFIRTERALD
jgi:hypothetical protein